MADESSAALDLCASGCGSGAHLNCFKAPTKSLFTIDLKNRSSLTAAAWTPFDGGLYR